ncbi:hypothetical protein CDAR_596741 [Caerostris darwini]|uniref:Uncharacterized protein n=1 Tax=Caerostris darwini TaxID=1538125 RepID=A0AAV4WCA9_9ARAC|nr:hypothetical protein CDAR_596741 [Caerostris darwini]
MIEYRLRSLMNIEHLPHSNVDEGGGGVLFTKRSSARDHRLGTNDPKRPSTPQRGPFIEHSLLVKYQLQYTAGLLKPIPYGPTFAIHQSANLT